jgi:hypothetical protein
MQPVELVTSLRPYYYNPVQPLRLDRRHAPELHVSAAAVPYYYFAAVRDRHWPGLTCRVQVSNPTEWFTWVFAETLPP